MGPSTTSLESGKFVVPAEQHQRMWVTDHMDPNLMNKDNIKTSTNCWHGRTDYGKAKVFEYDINCAQYQIKTY